MSNLLEKASILTTPTAYNDGKLLSVKPNTSVGDFDFTRNSSATRVASNGLIEDVASGLSRIDYTDGVGHILLEPQSTNLVTDSQNYNGTYWGGQRGSVSDGGVGLFYLSPTSNVIKYEATVTQFNQMYYRLPSAVTIGNTYTQQGYVKCDDAPYIHFQIQGLSGNPFIIWDNVNNTVISADPSIDSYNITSLSDGWVKAEITFTASVASIYASLKTYFSTSSTSIVAGVPVGTIAYQTFVQVEQQSYATSYIPTSGSTVTRLGETLNNAGSSDLINSTEGVLYAEISALANSGNSRFISLSDGSNQNIVLLGYTSTDNRIRIFIKSANSTSTNNTSTTVIATNFNKIAIKYKENDFALWVNGTETFSDASGSTPIGLNQLEFEFGSGSKFEGKIKTVAVFKEALTDEELTCLTTI